jgi:(1->4)-alpha-D-glucan 1-alpha-D-glucosylmutase
MLREGPESPAAGWFDVDWDAQDGRILLPVLGDRLDACLPELGLDEHEGEPVLRYHDHRFPLRPGTEGLPLPELLDRQFYRLAWWRLARTELNYRRFFTVSELIAIDTERPEVFDATHGLLLRLHRDGVLDGFRVDHPDGLADPAAYLRRLGEASGGAYVVVEKILTGEERLPRDWACAGTTGYDALRRIDGVLMAPGPEDEAALAAAARGRADMTQPQGELDAEVNRLARELVRITAAEHGMRDHAPWALRAALAGTLAAYPVYRPYPEPGRPLPSEQARQVRDAAAAAAHRLPPAHAESARVLRDLLLEGGHDEFRARFAQTASAVAAKGVEDTAFYRHHALLGLNEVGGDPAHAGLEPEEFHAWCTRTQQEHPLTMTALSTHDTKRSADARARLAVLAEIPREWQAETAIWQDLAPGGGLPHDPDTEDLLWQTAFAAWPIGGDRLAEVLLKSVREAKLRTSWTDPDEGYEQQVATLARSVPTTPQLAERIGEFVARTAPYARVNTLSAALLHLTVPGVPDLYQGSELPLRTLVDPDNRGIVRLDPPPRTEPGTLAAEKLHVTRTALRVRRADPHPDYTPWPTGSPHLLAFLRGARQLTVVTRLPYALVRAGGWGALELELPPGEWRDELADRRPFSSPVKVGELLADLPVALLTTDR